jgi:Ca-activated chloride channel family protein
MYNLDSGNVVASTRTYGRPQQMEVAAGKYTVKILALNLKGTDINVKVEDVMVEANVTNSISHDFKSGIALIGVKTASGDLIDATVNFHDAATGNNITGGRTYTSESSNPKEFVLNPGMYEVKVMTLGVHKGNKNSFTITVEEGKTVEKIISF